MTFDPSKPVQTRDGRPARIICTNRINTDGRNIIALVADRKGQESTYLYKPSGRYVDAPGHEQVHDLINVPEKTSKFRAIWGKSVGYVSNTLEIAAGVGKAQSREDSPLLGVLEQKYEDGVFVGVEFHMERKDA